MRQPNPREVSEANEQPGRGKRSAAPYQGHRGTGFAGPLVSSPVGESGEADSGGYSFLGEEFASAPNAASSARHRVSGTDVARLFFGYFFFGFAEKK